MLTGGDCFFTSWCFLLDCCGQVTFFTTDGNADGDIAVGDLPSLSRMGILSLNQKFSVGTALYILDINCPKLSICEALIDSLMGRQ